MDLDTVVLLGSMASTYGEHRWHFAAWAAIGSGRVVHRHRVRRAAAPPGVRPARGVAVLDGVVAVVVTVLGTSLAVRGHAGEWRRPLSAVDHPLHVLGVALARHRDRSRRPGEAVELDTRLPHCVGAVGAGAVEFLSPFGRQGERAHLRARPAGPDSA